MTSLLYTAELDLAESDIQPFLDWYAYRHAPDLVPLGFQSCACYRTTGGDMNLFDIYEIPNHDIFAGPGYARMNARDKYAAPILEKRRKKAHTIYVQHNLSLNGLVTNQSPLDADWISVFRFDSSATPSHVAEILAGETWEGTGVDMVRLGTRTTNHPVYTTDRPQFLISFESQRRPARVESIIERVVQNIETKASVSRRIRFDGRRVYPWPDQSPSV